MTKNVFTVTKLVHKKNQKYEVFIRFPNNEIHKEPVHEELILRFRLVEGKVLTEEEMGEFKEKQGYGEVYQAAMRLVAAKSYTMAELSKKLLTKEFDQDTIDEVLFKLVELGLLNDERFAVSYINHQIVMGKKGPSLIKRELLAKGVSQSIIDRHLSKFGDQEALEHAEKMARSLVKKNSKYGARFLRQKVSQHLQLKGFSSAIARQAVEAALEEMDEGDEQDILLDQARKLYRKYSRLPEFEGKQKLIQALGRKGFSYDEAKGAYAALMEEGE